MAGPTTLERPASTGPAPIDPRIRARRIEVRRHEGRRRLHRLVELGLVVAVAAAFFGALWTPLLDVDEVQVTGTAHVDADAVRAEAGIVLGDPLVTVDLGAVGAQVARLPWVAQVEVSRGIDGIVAISVSERAPVARLGQGPEALLVDLDGRVLGPAGPSAGDDPARLVELLGVDAPAPGGYLPGASADALVLAARLAESAPGALASLRVDDLTGTLAQGGEVRFGDATVVDAKVRSLTTALAQVDLTCLAVLDLRLPGSPVLTREQGCS